MKKTKKKTEESTEVLAASRHEERNPGDSESMDHPRQEATWEAYRWWIKLLVQPALLLVAGIMLIVALGAAQRWGLVSAGGGEHAAASGGESIRYICPMMCTPPQSEPGRCPVCAMELVPAAAGEKAGSRSIQIDSVARRIANIETVPVRLVSSTRILRTVGELRYDEGSRKTISAYVDGRVDRLYADYTGAVVQEDDQLALMYSPRLYAGQVELLSAKKAHEDDRSPTSSLAIDSRYELYECARRRLKELGMTDSQIEQLEEAGQANSRMHLCAPIQGTVIEKMVVEGQYVKEGEAIYQLADLSTVWLMLQLSPTDAATIQHGQKVDAHVHSLPSRSFTGHVAFVDPQVDSKTRTVGVRVVISNQERLLRVGDYAKATIEVPLWTDPEGGSGEALTVPRNAVLMAGGNSVAYVETEPGRFELRRIVLGPTCGDQIVIQSGVSVGEQVATRGNFLIDSQMQLAGNPSLIDPTRSEPAPRGTISDEMVAALSKLSADDRELVRKQRFCPVAEYPLGSMGTPTKVDVNGTLVFLCCEGCRGSLLKDPEKYLAKLFDHNAFAPVPTAAATIDLPPIGEIQLMESEEGHPPPESPREIAEVFSEREATRPSDEPVQRVAERLREVPQ